MTQVSHTPGPWEAKDFFEWDDTIRINSPDETLIARVKRFGVAEAEANARLIAKAPEMYEVLTDVSNAIGGAIDITDTKSILHDLDIIYGKAERLIAEIEGESE